MATKKNLSIPLVIFLIALAVRLYGLGKTAVFADEISWMVFGKDLFYSLAKHNLDFLKNAWWASNKETYAIGLPVTLLSSAFYVSLAGASKYSLNLFSDIVAARLPLVIISSLTPVLIYHFCRRLKHRTVGLIAAVGYALNPITIAVDRWVINDSTLTLFSFAAISSFVLLAKESKFSFWPGIFLALAFLSKPHGILAIIPWFVYLVLDRKESDLKLIVGNITSFFAATLLWPASWWSPVFSVFEYIARQFRLSNIGVMNYYFGRSTTDPGWTYYFFQFFFKTPEIVLLALIAFLVAFYKRFREKFGRENFFILVSIFIYLAAIFTLVTFNQTKTGIRYILPLYPWIYIAAGWGWRELLGSLRAYLKPLFVFLSFGIVLVPLNYFPNYYNFYNSLIGGASGAQKYDMVGLCLGDKAAFEYLDSNNIPGIAAIVGCPDTGPYHTRRKLTKDQEQADLIIVESAYLQQYPESPLLARTLGKKPIKKIIENGIITARIYQTR